MAILGLLAALAFAQASDAFDLPWFTIDSGGELHMSGGTLTMSATVGQLDTGSMSSAGCRSSVRGCTPPVLQMRGGFWSVTASEPQPGDCDGDGDVDFDDYAAFEACFTGAGGGLEDPSCACFDQAADGDVDLRDFAALQSAFSGAVAE